MKDSKIEWCDHTFNPWMGCTKVSPACDHCYAEVSGPARVHRARGVEMWGPQGQRVRTSAANWRQPLRWNAEAQRLGVRYRVFCASLADVFDNAVPDEWRLDMFQLIGDTPNLDWLLLTKRIGNAEGMYQAAMGPSWADNAAWPSNVWIGATVVNQAEANRDIPKLLAVPAAKRFLSMEPLLEHVIVFSLDGPVDVPHGAKSPIDWVIVGGESGPHARPMHPAWVRDMADQCAEAGVAFFFKQWGEFMPPESASTRYPANDWRDVVDSTGATRPVRFVGDAVLESSRQVVRVGKKAAGRLLDGREWNEVPA